MICFILTYFKFSFSFIIKKEKTKIANPNKITLSMNMKDSYPFFRTYFKKIKRHS